MKNRSLTFAAMFLLGVLNARGLLAQESRVLSAEGKTPIHWTLQPPVIGKPCPSELNGVDAPKALVMGTYKLGRNAVTDGDTIRVEGLKESLRFLGIDAEETFKDAAKRRLAENDWNEYLKTENAGHDPAHPPKYGTFMGEAAKDAIKQLLDGVSEVRLEWDDEDRKVDVYGRHLVFVLFQKNGKWTNLNVEMVRQGLTPYFTKYGRTQRMSDLFVAAQKEARAYSRGIWADPGLFRHYPDYAARLKWWTERADALDEAARLAKERTNFFIIGHDDDWTRLKTMDGKKAMVFGTPGTPIRRGEVVLVPFQHRKGLNFMIVGSEGEIAKLDLKKEEGNYLFVNGVVELYQGEPQFRAKTVTWSRTSQPSRAESAPATR
jgi:endonuclease YncB( thermonuclease family)